MKRLTLGRLLSNEIATLCIGLERRRGTSAAAANVEKFLRFLAPLCRRQHTPALCISVRACPWSSSPQVQRRRVHLLRPRSHSKYNNTISGCLVDVDNASYLGRTDPKKFGKITASLLENGLFAAWATSFLSLAVSLACHRNSRTPAHPSLRCSFEYFVEGYSSRKFGCWPLCLNSSVASSLAVWRTFSLRQLPPDELVTR